MMDVENTLTLHELNSIVGFGIRKVLPDTYWVIGELNEVRTTANGHCFVELVEKDKGSIPIAKARGTIWAANYARLRHRFISETGREISPGMKVRVNVSVEFHELYGYSLNIHDIDSSYTLGDLYLRRREIIARLNQAGVMDMNRELPLPAVIQRIALISSPTAAGYGDFCAQLDGNAAGIAFDITLFPAAMQGERVEAEVISALDRVSERCDDYDVVVLVRGGGATSDLSAFDSFEIAFRIAQFPLPVISGIGHERDRTVVDEVAGVSVKTPTAAAQHIITHDMTFVTRLDGIASSLAGSMTARLSREQLILQGSMATLARVATGVITDGQSRLQRVQSSIEHRMSVSLHASSARLAALASRLAAQASVRRAACSSALDRIAHALPLAAGACLTSASGRLRMMSGIIDSADPGKVLGRGYSIIRSQGKAVRSTVAFVPGGRYEVEVADGKTDIIIDKISQ